MADIAKNDLYWRTLEVRVRQYQALIEPDVKADRCKLSSDEAFDPVGLRHFVEARRAFLLTAERSRGGER